MEDNPFAPPKAQVVDAADRQPPALKRRSVLMVIVFLIITLGIYYLIWFYRRRNGLNQLNSPKKLELWPLVLLTGLFVVQFMLGVLTGDSSVEEMYGPGLALFVRGLGYAVGIVMLVQCFRIKDIIEDHATPDGPDTLFAEQVKLSGIMTFFFSIVYLQWAINHYVIDAPARVDATA